MRPNIGGIADNELRSARTLSGEMTAANIAWPIPSQPSSISSRDWRFNVVKQALRQRYQAAPPNARALWPELFPEPPQRPPASSVRVARSALVSVIALAAGAVVLLLRIAGPSPLTTIWAEDRTVFLVQALASSGPPVCVLCRLSAAAAAAYRAIGVIPAVAGSGRRIRHCRRRDRGRGGALRLPRQRGPHSLRSGSAGCLRRRCCCFPSRRLRSPTAASTPPGTCCSRCSGPACGGRAAAAGWRWPALIGFLAGASTPLALALAPLLILRMAALRRVREHAVTAGLAAGLLLQLPVIRTGPQLPGRPDVQSGRGGRLRRPRRGAARPRLASRLVAAGRGGQERRHPAGRVRAGGGVRRDRGDPARAGPAGGRRRPRVRVPARGGGGDAIALGHRRDRSTSTSSPAPGTPRCRSS